MNTVTQVARAMQDVLTTIAQQAGLDSGFVLRASKLDGASFVQTLVFGWMANQQASLEELAQTAAACGVEISPQGLDQRFSLRAAECLKQVLQQAVTKLIASDPLALPLVERFTGLFIHDSSTIVLPDEVKHLWQGCGGSTPSGAALKLQVRLELRTGQLDGPFLHHGRENDPSAEVQHLVVPRGALRLADLGYWSVKRFAEIEREGGYWMSRLQAGTVVFSSRGLARDVIELLEEQGGEEVELEIELSALHRLKCRLLAQKVPPQVSAHRRRLLKRAANKQGKTPTNKQLAMADWTIIVTNVSANLLSLEEAMVILRVRWQIELLFKLWKSHGQIDKSRSSKPERILCEVMGKLLAMLIEHWVLLSGGWRSPQRSLFKAVKAVQKEAWHLASVIDHLEQLCKVLKLIGGVLAASCRMTKRKRHPSTYQRLCLSASNALA